MREKGESTEQESGGGVSVTQIKGEDSEKKRVVSSFFTGKPQIWALLEILVDNS